MPSFKIMERCVMTHLKFNLRTLKMGLWSAFAVLLIAASTSALAQPVIVAESDESKHAGQFVVSINKSQILRVDVPFVDVLVGNSEIADILPLTDRTIYILGKTLGSTSLTVYGGNKRLIAVMDLVVSRDIDGLKAQLHEILPDERIEVRAAGDSLVLSGTVANPGRISRALAIAQRYAPDSITNLMSVASSQQVMLAVRFAEIRRTVMKDLGINTSIVDPDIPFTFTGLDAVSPTSIASAMTGFTAGSLAFDFVFDALEEKGLVKTLAEPNLIAMSGDTANFLAGGEFPIPVARESNTGGDTITIEFKEFGVALAFTPTVLENELINIAVSPEVSAIDRTNSVTLQGFNVPGLTTRRATTTVELRDGQSFAIAGLLQSDFQDQVRQLPGIGDVPIIGALVRSTEFQKNETELVIIVTPHLVQPAPSGTLATPVDNFVPPSDIGIFLMGSTEGGIFAGSAGGGAHALSAQAAGGIEGNYGHIIK